jgi:hypothetical protein
MITKDGIEAFLNKLTADQGGTFSEVEGGLWLVRPEGELDFDFVVSLEDNVAVLHVKVMDLPKKKTSQATLNRRLLELNATDLIHGAYGIEQDAIVMTEALELSHLDYDEFRAAYESMTVALASHLRELGAFREAQ